MDLDPVDASAQIPRNAAASRLPQRAALVLAGVGATLIAAALLLALSNILLHWSDVKVLGRVERIVTSAQADGRSAPVISFKDQSGATHTLMMTHVAAAAQRWQPGDRVTLAYDPRAPSAARLAGSLETALLPLGLATLGALLLVLAAATSAPPERWRRRAAGDRGGEVDPARLQYHPFNAIALTTYLRELGTAESGRKVRLTEATQALATERIPVGLCEALAYASALAYAPGAADFLAKHMPRARKPVLIEEGGARALAYLFERHVVIVLAEEEAIGLLAQIKGLMTPRAGPRADVPEETVWDAAPRRASAARAWHQLRAGLEAWLHEAAPEAARYDEEKARVPVILTGHGLGGTMALLAASEFAKRGRAVAAVVTFGAPSPGGKAFAQDYADLGLEARTLALETPRPALSWLRWPLTPGVPAAQHWRLPADLLTAPALNVLGGPASSAPARVRLALLALRREEARGLLHKRGAMRELLMRLFASSPSVRRAMLRHDCERRYALVLSLLMQRRLRQSLAESGRSAEVAQAFSDHLLDLRGVRPAEAHLAFLTLADLPPPDVEGPFPVAGGGGIRASAATPQAETSTPA